MSDKRHLWVGGHNQSAWAEAVGRAVPTVTVDCHRRLRGPYSGTGALLRELVPALSPEGLETLRRHGVEVAAVAPELKALLPELVETLTSAAPSGERTRWYSRFQSRRMAQGVIDLLRELAAESAAPQPLVLAFDRVDEADTTDHEFLTLALRRLDPARIRLLVRSGAGELPDELLAACRAHAEIPGTEAGAGAATASPSAYETSAHQTGADQTAPDHSSADRTEPDRPAAPSSATSAAELEELARAYVATECTAPDEQLAAAYTLIPADLRARLHDERADQLARDAEWSACLGAIPFHREHGADPAGAGVKALLKAASLDIDQGYYAAALELCERARPYVDEQDFVAYYTVRSKTAQCLAALDRADECEPLYYDLLSRTENPGPHMSLHYALGMLYTRLYSNERKDHGRAIAYLNTSIALASQLPKPEDRAFHVVFLSNGKALAEMHAKNLPASLKLVTDGIARLDAELPSDKHLLHRSVLRYNRGQVLAGLGRLDEAVAEYDYVVEVDPAYPEYRFDRGNLHMRRGEHAAALADYEAAMRLGPPFPELYYNRGDLRSAVGDDAGAAADFAYVLDLEPDHLEARISLASVLLNLGDAARAAAEVRTGLGFAPDEARLYCTLGLALSELGGAEAAAAAFDKALSLDPGLAEARVNRAVLAYEQGRFDAALEDLTAVLAGDPDNPDLLFNRGLAHEAVERWDRAAEDYTRALRADDADRSELLFRRAHCLTELGRVEVARADLEALLALGDSPHEEEVGVLLAGSVPAS